MRAGRAARELALVGDASWLNQWFGLEVAAMLDFEGAKRVAREQWLSAFDDEPGGPQVIHDAQCVEYEWGWQIEWGPSRPDEMPPEERRYRLLVLVDRVTGHLQSVSTAGPRIAIMKLLERRPPEGQSPDVSSEELGGLRRITVSMRAFTPLSKLQAGSPEASESAEVFRLKDGSW